MNVSGTHHIGPLQAEEEQRWTIGLGREMICVPATIEDVFTHVLLSNLFETVAGGLLAEITALTISPQNHCNQLKKHLNG
jgi:hypothetical protein